MTPAQALALIDNPPLRHLTQPTRWADLGCGSGLFTLALAGLLQPASTIYAVDRHPTIAQQITDNQVSIQPQKKDFAKKDLGLRDLDGLRRSCFDTLLLGRNLRFARLPHGQLVSLYKG